MGFAFPTANHFWLTGKESQFSARIFPGHLPGYFVNRTPGFRPDGQKAFFQAPVMVPDDFPIRSEKLPLFLWPGSAVLTS
jgi:hypothetical protein